MVQRSCLPLRKGTNPVVGRQRYAAAEDLVEKPFNAGFESQNWKCVHGLFLSLSLCINMKALISCPLCPLACPSRGHLSLQSMRNLVSEWKEPARPSDVLLQWATEGARDCCGGKWHHPPPDTQYLPIPTVQQELLWSQSFGNALEHITQWWVTTRGSKLTSALSDSWIFTISADLCSYNSKLWQLDKYAGEKKKINGPPNYCDSNIMNSCMNW